MKGIPKQIKANLVKVCDEVRSRKVSGKVRCGSSQVDQMAAHTTAMQSSAEQARVERITELAKTIAYSLAEARADYVQDPDESVVQFWARMRWEMATALVDQSL